MKLIFHALNVLIEKTQRFSGPKTWSLSLMLVCFCVIQKYGPASETDVIIKRKAKR